MKSSLKSRGLLLLWFLSMVTVISVQAQVVSPEKFNADGPMEIKATSEQVARLVEGHAGKSYLLFPEDRRYPIRMTDAIPKRWIEKGPSDSSHGSAQPGEFYVFQVGLFAARKAITDVRIEYSDLKGPSSKIIRVSARGQVQAGCSYSCSRR